MSGGPRQLFDPEAPPLAAAPVRSGAVRRPGRRRRDAYDPDLRRDTHPGPLHRRSLRAVEGALDPAFPRNRPLWVRGEIQHVSDHRSGHLYMGLVDPEDDGRGAR